MTGYSLHVGLNVVDTSSYIPAPAVLAGCVNDANDMARLAGNQGFRTRTLLDGQATSSAVLAAIGELARTTVDGDIALITYSGHGGQIGDTNGDETDSLDETWCCYDRQVIDDELYRMWGQFPAGVRILVFSDSCHSGTVARSIMAIATREALVRNPLGAEYWPADVRVEKLRPRAMPPSVAAADFSRRRDLYSAAQAVAGTTRATDIAAEVLLISGCQDNQLSSDGDSNGLFTEKVLRVWNNGAFSGDYRAFHSAIVSQMPPDQTPNLYTVGTVTAGFQAQRPFTIAAPPPSGGGGGWGQPTTPATPTTTRRTLRQGDSGEDVRYLQQKLVDNGAWLTVDGQFGSITASAVRNFQSSHGLTADGVVGPQTWAALEGASSGSGGSASGGGSGSWNTGSGGGSVSGGGSGSWGSGGSSGGGSGGGSGSWGDGGSSGGGSGGWSGGWNDTSGGSGGGSGSWGSGGGSTGGGTSGGGSGSWGGGGSTGGGTSGGGSGSWGGGGSTGTTTARPTIRRGSTGDDVRYLQQRLSALGYWLTVDGQFGPGTESQVRSFQRSQGLTADGVVGPKTWAALG